MAAALSSLENAVATITLADAPPVTGFDRHCAFCLDLVPAEKVLRCGKCQRRAYCSKQCQERDWSIKTKKGGAAPQQRGQGHKNWCGLAAGEEDLDWKVTEIEGKGLGLVALRDIPAGSRIMVEAGQPTPFSHPKTSELMPLTNVDAEGNLKPASESELRTKFALNCLNVSRVIAVEGDVKEVLCPRIARANHNCFNNAAHVDSDLNVKILFAVKDISTGEEICISYINFTAPALVAGLTALQRHATLESKWGFDCPSDSRCRDEKVQNLTDNAAKLYGQIIVHSRSLRKIDKALEALKVLLRAGDCLEWPQTEKGEVLYRGFEIAVTRRATLEEAKVYVSKYCGLVAPIYHPNEGWLCERLSWKEDFQMHPDYLRMDKAEAEARVGGQDVLISYSRKTKTVSFKKSIQNSIFSIVG